MKKVNELSLQTGPRYTREEYDRVTAFVASVFSLFADYRGEFTKEEFFKSQCRMYAADILKFSEAEYTDRLEKTKRLVAVPGFKNLIGNYRTANSALAIACSNIDNLYHDYHLVFPIMQKDDDFMKRVTQAERMAVKKEMAKEQLKKIKDELGL